MEFFDSDKNQIKTFSGFEEFNLFSFVYILSDDDDDGDDYDDGDYDDDVRSRELTHTVCVLLSPFSSLLLADDVVPSKTVHRNVMLCTSM